MYFTNAGIPQNCCLMIHTISIGIATFLFYFISFNCLAMLERYLNKFDGCVVYYLCGNKYP